jgi:HPt (histidine-containing phosphotransfer) domain-containing protein
MKLSLLEEAARGNSRDFMIMVHAMKGALANIGASALSEEAAKLEAAAQSGDVRALEGSFRGFVDRVKELTARITAVLAGYSGDDDADGGFETLRPASVSKLKKALAERDIGVIDAALEELSTPRFGHRVANALTLISDHVLLSNFEEAADIADNLLKEAEI